jgi:hypothetical protein
MKRRKANWIGHSLRRNCLLKHVIEGEIEEKVRRGKTRCKQLEEEEDASSYSMTLRK